MRKPHLLLLTIMLCCHAAAQAQATRGGGISADMLARIRAQQPEATVTRALTNAIAANAIDDLARSRRNAGPVPSRFSVETPAQTITDQKQSGRCWMFSGFNVLRADFARRHADSLAVELSQGYLFFWDQLEKANLFLQGIIDCADQPIDSERVRFFMRSPIGDGGTFCGVADLAAKYGLVPAEVVPETYSSENTARMSRLVGSKLREYGLELRALVAERKTAAAIAERKTEMLADIYHILALTLGEPVTDFDYAFCGRDGKVRTATRHYTPQTFCDEIVGRKLDGTFIMVMNDPRREYHRTYEVEWDRHSYDGHNWCYLNLPMADIEQLAIAQLRAGRKLYSSYDVGKQLDRKRGYCDLGNFDYESLFQTTFAMNKADRIATFDSGSPHAMTLAAVDVDAQGKPVAWKVENSWGADWGQKGCLVMSAEWFREYMFRLVVDKEYVPDNLLREASQKPTIVMPEDPLFQADE
ncbi:MAG: C1 family peptidase [Bacteroidaceae bacterium]|nr:C1 family peptidase [Bacteroidaceae bacterium]